MSQITARDFMVTKLVTLNPEMDVMEAIERLLKYHISGAPVVDSAGNYLGVFSEKCCMHVILDAAYEQLPSNKVQVFMDTDAQTIGPDTHLMSIAQLFLLSNYRRLPVLEDGRLIGQVSRRDVIKAAMDILRLAPRDTETTLLYLSALVERSEAPMA